MQRSITFTVYHEKTIVIFVITIINSFCCCSHLPIFCHSWRPVFKIKLAIIYKAFIGLYGFVSEGISDDQTSVLSSEKSTFL